MASDSGNSKIECYLCGRTIEGGYEICTRTIKGKSKSFCKHCAPEVDYQLNRIERRARQWVSEQITTWLNTQKIVKRFYRRQHKLSLDGGVG